MARTRLIGAVAALVALLALVLVFKPPPVPWQPTLALTVQAPSFGELNPAAEVDLDGVRIGQVTSMVTSDGYADLRLQVDARYAGLLHRDASASIETHGLLGPKYVQLAGGSSGRLGEGAVIPASRVHVTTDLDQVLDALQPDTRQSLRTLIIELGKGSDGRGQDTNATLESLGAASDDLERVTDELRKRDQDLGGIVDSSERLNRDLQYAPVDRTLRDTDTVLSGLVKVDPSIGSGIDHTARVLRALDVVLGGNSGNLAALLSRAPRAVLRLRAFLAIADQLAGDLNPAIPALLSGVVESESSFSHSDANGHFVRIVSVTNTCLVGVNNGALGPSCAGYTGPSGGKPARGQSGLPLPAPSEGVAPTASHLSDKDLLEPILGR